MGYDDAVWDWIDRIAFGLIGACAFVWFPLSFTRFAQEHHRVYLKQRGRLCIIIGSLWNLTIVVYATVANMLDLKSSIYTYALIILPCSLEMQIFRMLKLIALQQRTMECVRMWRLREPGNSDAPFEFDSNNDQDEAQQRCIVIKQNNKLSLAAIIPIPIPGNSLVQQEKQHCRKGLMFTMYMGYGQRWLLSWIALLIIHSIIAMFIYTTYYNHLEIVSLFITVLLIIINCVATAVVIISVGHGAGLKSELLYLTPGLLMFSSLIIVRMTFSTYEEWQSNRLDFISVFIAFLGLGSGRIILTNAVKSALLMDSAAHFSRPSSSNDSESSDNDNNNNNKITTMKRKTKNDAQFAMSSAISIVVPLRRILRSSKGIILIQKYVFTNFAVETMFFYREVVEFKRKCRDFVKRNSIASKIYYYRNSRVNKVDMMLDPIVDEKRFNIVHEIERLFQTYLIDSENAMFPVAIPNRVRKAYQRFFDSSGLLIRAHETLEDPKNKDEITKPIARRGSRSFSSSQEHGRIVQKVSNSNIPTSNGFDSTQNLLPPQSSLQLETSSLVSMTATKGNGNNLNLKSTINLTEPPLNQTAESGSQAKPQSLRGINIAHSFRNLSSSSIGSSSRSLNQDDDIHALAPTIPSTPCDNFFDVALKYILEYLEHEALPAMMDDPIFSDLLFHL